MKFPLKLFALHTYYLTLENLRQPMYLISTFVFPSLFFWFFGIPNAPDPDGLAMLTASFCAFAVLSVVLFQFGIGVATDRETSWYSYLRVLPAPRGTQMISRIASGIICGFLLSLFFKKYHSSVRATEKVLIVLIFATALVRLGDALHFAALLGVMTCGFIILEMHEKIAHELSGKLSKIWIFAEIILFVLIGFSLDVETAFTAGPKAIIAITIGLIFRSIGVFIATAFSNLTTKERVFCMIAYIPKATVQAALGGVALSYGIAGGDTILSIAVISILFTAPLGLVGIKTTEKYLLKN